MNVLCSWLWRLPRNPQMKEVDSFIFVSLRMHVRSCWYGHAPLCAFNFKFASLLSYRPVKWISSRLGRRNLPVPLPHWEWQRPSEPEGGLGGHWAVPCFPTPRDSGSRRETRGPGLGRRRRGGGPNFTSSLHCLQCQPAQESAAVPAAEEGAISRGRDLQVPPNEYY